MIGKQIEIICELVVWLWGVADVAVRQWLSGEYPRLAMFHEALLHFLNEEQNVIMNRKDHI
ncbi:MAG: hypothetical protein PVSMB11_00400 [Desulfuromonadaceae bacterium]